MIVSHISHSVPVKFGIAGCIVGQCNTVKCTLPYILCRGECTIFPSAAARARARRQGAVKNSDLCPKFVDIYFEKKKKLTIFPSSETACPIRGSKSFFLAQASGFVDFRSNDSTALNLAGGFEW